MTPIEKLDKAFNLIHEVANEIEKIGNDCDESVPVHVKRWLLEEANEIKSKYKNGLGINCYSVIGFGTPFQKRLDVLGNYIEQAKSK